MLKIDERQHSKSQAFWLAALYGVVNGSVVLTVHGKTRTIKAFSLLRKVFKSDVYRCAKLAPRVSDVDFLPGEAINDVMQLVDASATQQETAAADADAKFLKDIGDLKPVMEMLEDTS